MQRAGLFPAIIQCAPGSIMGTLLMHFLFWTHNRGTGTFPLGRAYLIISMGSMQPREKTARHLREFPEVSPGHPKVSPVTL